MKKLLLLTISIFSLFAFAACSSDLDNFKDEAEITSIKGVLEEKEASDNFNGSYKLVSEDEETIPLRSLSIKLGSKQYLNNMVTVSGLMNEEDNVFEVTGVRINEVLSEDSYKGKFVSYKNSALNFQLKYYDDWSLIEGTSAVAFYANSNEETPMIDSEQVKISRETFEYVNNTTEEETEEEAEESSPLASYYNENFPEDQKFPEIENLSSEIHKIGVDLIDALKLEYTDGKIEFITYRPGYIYTLAYIPGENDENKNIFNEMVLEFQFLGETVDAVDAVDAIDSPFVDLETSEDELVQSTVTETIDEETGEILYETSSIYHEYTPFESALYSFSALMPDDWYYAGSSSSAGDVLHHYAFSEGPLEDDLSNEALGLDIISSDIPSGETIMIDDIQITGNLVGDQYFAYRSIGGHNFRMYALHSKELYDVLITMAASITTIED